VDWPKLDTLFGLSEFTKAPCCRPDDEDGAGGGDVVVVLAGGGEVVVVVGAGGGDVVVVLAGGGDVVVVLGDGGEVVVVVGGGVVVVVVVGSSVSMMPLRADETGPRMADEFWSCKGEERPNRLPKPPRIIPMNPQAAKKTTVKTRDRRVLRRRLAYRAVRARVLGRNSSWNAPGRVGSRPISSFLHFHRVTPPGNCYWGNGCWR
jgi:hypothetical protein